MYTISNIKRMDLGDLAKLYEQFWGEESSISKMNETFTRIEKDENYILLGLKIDGRLAGSVMGVICQELYGDCKPFMVVEDVIVDKSFRRKGMGTKLMNRLETIAKQRNCSNIMFVTEKERKDAHRFYSSLGFKHEGYKGYKKKLSFS